MGQIDQITVEDSVVVPAVGIGQQLAADEVVQREGGNAADRVFLAGHLQADPALQHDLQLDGHPRHHHACPDAVLVCERFAALLGGVLGILPKCPQAVVPPDQLAQFPVAMSVGHQQIHIHRLAELPVAQGNGRAAAEQAVVLLQELRIELVQQAGDPSVVLKPEHQLPGW